MKLIVHSLLHQHYSLPHKELVDVFVPFYDNVILPLMLEIFIKRWQTMDLISMMRELGRSLAEMPRRGFLSRVKLKNSTIEENLSCLVRFIMHEEPTN